MDNEVMSSTSSELVAINNDYCQDDFKEILSLDFEELHLPSDLYAALMNEDDTLSLLTNGNTPVHHENIEAFAANTSISSVTSKQPLLINPDVNSHSSKQQTTTACNKSMSVFGSSPPLSIQHEKDSNQQLFTKAPQSFKNVSEYPPHLQWCHQRSFLPQQPLEEDNYYCSNMQLYQQLSQYSWEEFTQTISHLQQSMGQPAEDMDHTMLPQELLLKHSKGEHDSEKGSFFGEFICSSDYESLEIQTNYLLSTSNNIQKLEITDNAIEITQGQGEFLHLGRNQFNCSSHEKGFSCKKSLEPDKLIHHGEKPFQCDICQRRFLRKVNLEQHMPVHTEEKSFQCDLCERKYSSRRNLRRHKQIHTGVKPFQCDLCRKEFLMRDSLKCHMQIHTGVKPFQCDLCKKKFLTRDSKKRHMQIHTGVKLFQCNLCEKKFSQKSNLKRHKWTHTKFRPFKCDECETTFKYRPSLKRHKKIHTGIKPFQCDLCEKNFLEKRHLMRHKLIHTGIKPFQCDLCDKEFSRKYNLKSHNCIHPPEETVSL